MHIRFFILVILFLPSLAIAEMQSPDDVAYQFYTWLLSEAGAGSGLPTTKDKEQLAQFFSPGLLKLLDAAVVMEQRCIENNPAGDKPYTVEGNIFVGNYEGASEVVVGQLRQEGKNIIVASRLLSIDSRFPKAHKYRVHTWTDQLVLSSDKTRWLISNIKFESGTSLWRLLEEYIKESELSCKPTHASLNSGAQ